MYVCYVRIVSSMLVNEPKEEKKLNCLCKIKVVQRNITIDKMEMKMEIEKCYMRRQSSSNETIIWYGWFLDFAT